MGSPKQVNKTRERFGRRLARRLERVRIDLREIRILRGRRSRPTQLSGAATKAILPPLPTKTPVPFTGPVFSSFTSGRIWFCEESRFGRSGSDAQGSAKAARPTGADDSFGVYRHLQIRAPRIGVRSIFSYGRRSVYSRYWRYMGLAPFHVSI